VTEEQACEERNLINILFTFIHTASSGVVRCTLSPDARYECI